MFLKRLSRNPPHLKHMSCGKPMFSGLWGKGCERGCRLRGQRSDECMRADSCVTVGAPVVNQSVGGRVWIEQEAWMGEWRKSRGGRNNGNGVFLLLPFLTNLSCYLCTFFVLPPPFFFCTAGTAVPRAREQVSEWMTGHGRRLFL